MSLLLLLLLSLSTSSSSVYGDDHCQRTQLLPIEDRGVTVHLVRFFNQSCAEFDYKQSHPFCGNSGWGDEEASVVCRSERNMRYGIGGYKQVAIEAAELGFSHVRCTSEEKELNECTVGDLTSHSCSQVGILQCFNFSQVVVSIANVNEPFEHVEVPESGAVVLCIAVWGPVTEALHVLVQTTDSGIALAHYDYHPLSQTLTFEPSNMTRSHQCLQIGIIDDSLAEDWEMFSVLLSTNSSAVNLTRQEFNVFIEPHDDREPCIEGSVTLVGENSLQLVERCSNGGKWSPMCDYNWSLQDAIVVCRELGYQDVSGYETLDREGSTTTVSQCIGNETTLNECPLQYHQSDTICQYVLVQCGEDGDPDDKDMENSTVHPGDEGGSNATTDIGSSGNGSSSDVGDGDGDDGDGDDGDGDDGDDGDGDDGDGDDGDSGGDTNGGDGGDKSESGDGDDGESKSDQDKDGDNIGSGSNNNTTEEEPPSEEEGGMLSVEVFSGVVVAVLVVLILIVLGVIFLVYMKRKNKHVFPKQYVDSEENQTKGEKYLDNPTYNSSLKYPPSSQPSQAQEHNLVNPLYDLNSEYDNKPEYAVLEGPANYAVPIDLHVPHLPKPVAANSTAEIPDTHDYDYADINMSTSKAV